MKIYKFGGASIKDAAAIRNVATILKGISEPLVVVISAMGKMTNKLEQLVSAAYANNRSLYFQLWEDIKTIHVSVARELGVEKDVEEAYQTLSNHIDTIGQNYLWTTESNNYDEVYDQLIFLGELMSTKLVCIYLQKENIPVQWKDARDFIITDSNYRMATIDWGNTIQSTKEHIFPLIDTNEMVVTQGFIGRSIDGKSTSLGREGSDYTAAVLAYCLDAESVTVWKDVPGVLTADPRKVDDAELIQNLTFRDAIELTYYGAQVIHPKTIQPLQKKDIPLFVRSFIDPNASGTKIHSQSQVDMPPMIVITEDQYLVQISSKDYSFIAEEHLSTIFRLLNYYRIRVNLMRNSAISFYVSVSAEKGRFDQFIQEISPLFSVEYLEDLTLITIRHYDQETIERFKGNNEVIFEENHGITHQMILALQ